MTIALVAMLGLNSCSNEQNFIEVDHSADLVGTWTCLEANYASSLVFTADGKVVSSGLSGGEYWEDMNGVFSTENNQLSISFENGHTFDGRLDMVANRCMSIANEDGTLHTYNYCANDLADEVVGMWVVANGGPDMTIETFNEDGTAIFTGVVGEQMNLNSVLNYKVVGDLMFYTIAAGQTTHIAYRLIYSPNATSYGDLMTWQLNDDFSFTRLRIKQSLDLAEQKYDYIKTFISNVKGEDKDIEFFNTTFNFAKFDNSILDKFLKSTLFSVHFPDANTIEYSFLLGGQLTSMQAPIEVDGNKMTIKMSELNAVYRDVDVYTFQDQDNTQMHIYMPTSTFENFLGNMQLNIMAAKGQADLADAAAVKAVFDTIENAIETINVSLVMTKAER